MSDPAIGVAGESIDAGRLEHAAVEPQRLSADEPGATDGDGAMLGRVIVYASIVVVAVAMVVWKRVF